MKTHVNVGTIGHVDHGKTTLTAAILAVQAHAGFAKVKSYADIAKGGTVRDETKTVTIAISHVEYETETRHYAHIDCPGHADYIKNMITGAAQMDGAILLVDGSQGPQYQTKEHILLARQVGVERIVVFINKVDIADAELLELVVSEANEALELHGYQGSPVVMGSALKALRNPANEGTCIRELLEAMQTHFPDPVRNFDAPFMMPIEGVHTIVGSWHRRHGPHRAGRAQGQLDRRDRRARRCRREAAPGRRHGHPDVPQGPDGGPCRRERRTSASRRGSRRGGPRSGHHRSWLGEVAHEGEGRAVRHPLEGRGPPHPHLRGVPAAVLLRDDGRHGGSRGPAGGDR